jgi:hypothetical protein
MTTMRRATTSNLLGGAWLRGLLVGALAATPLLARAERAAGASDVTAAARAGDAVAARPSARGPLRLVGGRVQGDVRGARTRDAVAELASLLGARLRWIAPPGEGVVSVAVAGLGVEQALARVLGERSYLLLLGPAPEIHVLGGEDGTLGDGPPPPPAASDGGRERARLRRMAEVDRIAYGDAEPDQVGAELDALARTSDDPAVRLAAAERLFALDPGAAAGTLAWLSNDGDPAVRDRAEALLAAAREAGAGAQADAGRGR